MKFRKQCVLAIMAAGLVYFCSQQSFAQEEAIAEAIPEATASDNSDAPAKLRPLTVAAGLVDDSVITGTLMDSTAVAMKTAFGEASIPLSEVAGIRFPSGEDASTTIVMLNGDSITGATDLKYANIETTWGSAKINGQNIATMLFVPGLRWESLEALGGKRWTLVEATTQPTQNSNQNVVQPASGSRSRIQNSGQPIQGQSFPFRP
ncbi:MAG: hypothetical protein AB8B50_07955 [Pirellulaceae bacterium]